MANKKPDSFEKALIDAHSESLVAMEGFERVMALLDVIKHFAANDEQDAASSQFATIAREAWRIAEEYRSAADDAREAFDAKLEEVRHV